MISSGLRLVGFWDSSYGRLYFSFIRVDRDLSSSIGSRSAWRLLWVLCFRDLEVMLCGDLMKNITVRVKGLN